MSRGVEWLSGVGETPDFEIMRQWFAQVLALRLRFFASVSAGFDPLRLNETASVGLLAAAAARAGLLTITDYVSYKQRHDRRLAYQCGRCDLWVADPQLGLSWAFEFKQYVYGASTRAETIAGQLVRACDDARRIAALEAHRRFGGLIMAGPLSCDERRECELRLLELGCRSSFACRLWGGPAPIWVFLEAV